MHKLLITLILTICMAGCATEERYKKELNSWIGRPESELIRQKGVPNGIYKLDGNKYLTYQYQNISSYNGKVKFFHCDTTYVIENKVVIDWSFKGNACKM